MRSQEREEPPRAAPRPGPGEEPADGPPSEPRQAASVILLRGGRARLELLLVRRTPRARFMGGVWVFPGGAVETAEGAGEAAHRAAALRELREEAGIVIEDPAALVRFSRWITPEVVKIRFDTHFFLAELPSGQEARIDGQECVDLRWLTPAAALEDYERGSLELVFPTVKHLEQLRAFASAHELIEHARGRRVEPVLPRVVMEGEVARVLLPGEPGY